MPHVSRNKLSKKAEENLHKTFNLVLARLSKMEEINDFLSSLLSPTEKLMLAKRLAIVTLIKEGLPDAHIASTLNVTRETVSRMKLLFEVRGQGYEPAFSKLQHEKVMQELRQSLLQLAAYAARAGGGRVKPGIF